MTTSPYRFKFMEYAIFPQGQPPHMTVGYHLHRGTSFTGIAGFLLVAVPETQDAREIDRIATAAVQALEAEFLAAGITDDDSAEAWIDTHHALTGA